jgi:aldose 1-epimerase
MLRLVNFESGEYVTLLPFLGGRVHEIVLKPGKKLISILESPRTARDILENVHFAGVKLIPFAGRIVDGTYPFGGKSYKLRVNSKGNFAIHGFAADQPYEMGKSTARDDFASIVLSWTHDGTTKGYPFRFRVRLTYTLSQNEFTCATEIHNIDSQPIPVGDGWHPYLRTGSPTQKLLLSLPKHSVVEVSDPYKIPTGKLRKPTRGRVTIPLKQKEMDAVYDFGTRRERVTTRLIDPKLGLEIQLWQESGAGKYRYLIVHRPSSGTSIAVEPWTCAPNSFNNDMGLIVLGPGKKFRAKYGVRLKQN